MSIKQTEKRAEVIRIGKGSITARKTMSYCARVTSRKKGKQSCKYNKNNVVTLGNRRLHALDSGVSSSSPFGREVPGSFSEWSWVGICSGISLGGVWLGFRPGFVGLGFSLG